MAASEFSAIAFGRLLRSLSEIRRYQPRRTAGHGRIVAEEWTDRSDCPGFSIKHGRAPCDDWRHVRILAQDAQEGRVH